MQNGNGAAAHGNDAAVPAGGAAVPGNRAATTRQTTVADAARLLGIGERAVRWRIQKGLLAAERDGQGWRVFVPADRADAAATVAAAHGNGAAALGNPAAEDAGGAAEDGNRAAANGNVAAELAIARAVLAATEGERDHLRAQVAALQDRLAAEQERVREAHLLLLTQRAALPPADDHTPDPAPPARPWWRALCSWWRTP